MRNRVTPLGDIVATELRGAWTGNRGILHEGTEVVRFHRTDLWITCVLEFKGWRLKQWSQGHFTVLFLHDEAVSFAAGHRPCALCRRADYNAFRQALAADTGQPVLLAKDLDRQLHSERLVRGTHRRRLHELAWDELPEGTFAMVDASPALVLDDRVVPWTPAGYGRPQARPASGAAKVITPPSGVAVLRAGYPVQVDPSARDGGG
jgi:hypothetical protein